MIRAEDAEVRNGFLFVRNNTTNVWSEDVLVAKEKKRALFLEHFNSLVHVWLLFPSLSPSDLNAPSSSEEQLGLFFLLWVSREGQWPELNSFHCAVQCGCIRVTWNMLFSKPSGLPRGADEHDLRRWVHSAEASYRLYASLQSLAWPSPVSQPQWTTPCLPLHLALPALLLL